MKDRIVYLGPYNNKKSRELFDKATDYLRNHKGSKFYYILPNGNLLVKYRKKMLEEVGQTFDVNLFTFDNIVDRLLGDKFYTSIDSETKEALLTNVLKLLREEDKLEHYRDISSKIGFVKVVANIIGEIKRSLITPEDFLDRCPNTPFYTEIGLIYEEYERKLNELALIDREEGFLKSLEILDKDNSFFNGLDFIVIDYFFDFRPQELELLKRISKTNCSIYINMPFDRTENFDTFSETMDILEKLGFSVEKIEEESKSYFEELASIIFNKDDESLKANSNVHVIKGANSYLEMKKISEEVKRHYANGVNLNDMAIVMTNTDLYKDRIFQVFEEERIPLNLDKEISLVQIPLLEELVNILEVKKNHMDKNSIINRIKSNYFPLCSREDRDALEYILRKEKFYSSFEINIEDIKASIEEETKLIPAKAPISEFIKAVIKFLEKYDIDKRILYIYNTVEDYSLLNRDFSALDKFKEILNSINSFQSILYDEITIEEFLVIITDYLQRETIVETEGNSNGINILTPVISRGQKFNILFVTGLSQGDYPSVDSRNFFFREDNYRELKKIGIDIKNYYEKLDKESITFSTIISSCTDKLYLSYSQDSSEDEKGIPSIFLDELLNRIDGEKIEEKVNLITVDMDYIMKDRSEELTTKRELAQFLLRKYSEGSCEEDMFNMYNEIDSATFKEVNSRINCEYERDKDEFNQYRGLLDDKDINNDIKNIHKDKIYSISYLESYGKCPYYFLMNNILKVDEMEREFEEFTPLDKGSINHEVLKEYYFNFKSEIEEHILGKIEFNVDETYDFIEQLVKERMESISADNKSALWKLRVENSANRLMDFIKSDLDRLSKLKIKAIPYDFEAPFGRRENFEVEIDGLKIPFTGVIDRIDKYVDEDKYILIDYKNSEYSVKDIDNMKAGISLQLPVYILSQKNRNVVAAMYGVISSGKFEVKIGHVDEKHLVNSRNKGALTTEELEKLLDKAKSYIKSYIESILSGDFSVNPKECSSYCIYRDVCRYKKGLEVE